MVFAVSLLTFCQLGISKAACATKLYLAVTKLSIKGLENGDLTAFHPGKKSVGVLGSEGKDDSFYNVATSFCK